MPEQLRPFAHAGLELLFLPGGLPAAPAHGSAPAPAAENRAADTPHEPAEASLANLPNPWSTLASRVRTPPRVIITYASLADDLAGTADPARRKLFQNILAYLAWPQGTTLFWPISFPKGVDPGPLFASDLFAAGVRHYVVRHLLCFGLNVADRATTLFPQDDKTMPVVYRLPSPDDLVSLLPHELHKVLAAIKSLRMD